jgi:hypothetical protein
MERKNYFIQTTGRKGPKLKAPFDSNTLWYTRLAPANHRLRIHVRAEKVVNFEYGNFENLTSKKCLKVL